VPARKPGIGFDIAAVPLDRPHIGEDEAWPRSVHREFDHLSCKDRDAEQEQQVERDVPTSAQPDRHRDERDEVHATDDRNENHDRVQYVVRPCEVHRAKEDFVQAHGVRH